MEKFPKQENFLLQRNYLFILFLQQKTKEVGSIQLFPSQELPWSGAKGFDLSPDAIRTPLKFSWNEIIK